MCSSCSNELNFGWDQPRTICLKCEPALRDAAQEKLEKMKAEQRLKLEAIRAAVELACALMAVDDVLMDSR